MNTFSEIIESAPTTTTTSPSTTPTTYRVQETTLPTPSTPSTTRTSIDTYPTERDALRAQLRHEVRWGEWVESGVGGPGELGELSAVVE